MNLSEGRRGASSPHVTQAAISQLRRYYRFLHLIVARYDQESASYPDNLRRSMELAETSRSMGQIELTAEEIELFENGEALTDQLHLEELLLIRKDFSG